MAEIRALALRRCGLATAAALAGWLALSAALAAAPIPLRGRAAAFPGSGALAGARAELHRAEDSYAAALACLTSGGDDAPLASAPVGPGGGFELAAPGPGTYRVVLRAEGRLAMEHFPPPVVEPAELPLAELRPASPLLVEVLAPGGRPAAGIALAASTERLDEAERAPGWFPLVRRVATGPDGRVAVLRGRGERLALAVASPAFLGQSATAGTGERATLRLEARPAVRIEARDARGRPAARALVRVFGGSGSPLVGLTDAAGGLQVAAAPGHAVTLLVEDAAGGLAEVTLPATPPPATPARGAPLRADLKPFEALAGRVVDAVTRRPLAGAVVWSEPFPSDPSVLAGADGTFRLPLHRSPRLALGAGAAGHLPVRIEAPGEAAATLALPPAGEIAGLVVDAAGKAVGRARVQAEPTRGDGGAARGPAMAWSGRDGRFRLPRLAAGTLYRLRAERAGFAPGWTMAEAIPAAAGAAAASAAPAAGAAGDGAPGAGRAAGGREAPVRIVLSAGRTASGRLADGGGNPVAGAELELRPDGPPWGELSPGASSPRRAASDGDGGFAFRDLGPGRYWLEARAAGFSALERPGIEIPRGAGQVDLGTLRMTPGAAVEGRVVDRQGQPVEGARVMLVEHRAPWRPSGPPPETQTGQDGGFRLADLPPGETVELWVTRAGFPMRQVPGVEVPTPEPLVIEMEEGGSLSGRVVGDDGQPIAGASLSRQQTHQVTLRGASTAGRSGWSLGTTDERGRFEARDLAPGLLEITVSAPDHMPAELPGVTVQAGRNLDLGDITLRRGAVLEGSVTDADGSPAAGARISADRQRDPTERFDRFHHGGFAQPVETGADGRFRAGGLEPGRYHVTAWGEAEQRASAEVEVRPGVNRVDLAFERGVEVAGRVVGEAGEPVAGAAVRLRGGEGWVSGFLSGADGAFSVPGVRPGQYRVLASRQGYEEGEAAAPVVVGELPVAGVEVRLARRAEESGPALRGWLLGLSEREGLDVDVHTSRADGAGFARGGPDGRGGYVVDWMDPGEWRVSASLPGGRSAEGTVRIEPGAGTAVLDLDFRGGGIALRGLVSADGRPLAGAVAKVAGAPGETGELAYREATSGYDGRFELRDLAPGRYVLLVAREGSGLGAVREVALGEEDQEIAVDVETGVLEGRVISAAGAPVPGAVVSVTLHDERLQTGFAGPPVRADETGAFELRGLAAGSWRVRAEADGFAPGAASAEVTRGARAQAEVVLEPR